MVLEGSVLVTAFLEKAKRLAVLGRIGTDCQPLQGVVSLGLGVPAESRRQRPHQLHSNTAQRDESEALRWFTHAKQDLAAAIGTQQD